MVMGFGFPLVRVCKPEQTVSRPMTGLHGCGQPRILGGGGGARRSASGLPPRNAAAPPATPRPGTRPVPERGMVPVARGGARRDREMASALQRRSSAFVHRQSDAGGVCGRSRTRRHHAHYQATEREARNGPVCCDVWGLRSPAHCSIGNGGATWQSRHPPWGRITGWSQITGGPKNGGRSLARILLQNYFQKPVSTGCI